MLTGMRARDVEALGRGAAFLAGVGFAAVPAAGPFLALFAWLNQRLEIQRADRLWWLAAALLSSPLLLTGHPVAAVETLAQVLAAWLLFRLWRRRHEKSESWHHSRNFRASCRPTSVS